LKIEKPAKDIDSLGNVMHALDEIRKKQLIKATFSLKFFLIFLKISNIDNKQPIKEGIL
jgi:hypothetical protein